VPYASGETPMYGDRIKDKQGRQATVRDLLPDDEILIQWDEGVVEMEYPAGHFTLIARATK
jgi:hypothetical protein